MDESKAAVLEANESHGQGPGVESTEPFDGQGNGLRTSEIGGCLLPAVPDSLAETGVAPDVLLNLALKFAYTSPHFETEAAACHLRLPLSLVTDLLEQLRAEKLIEVLGGVGPFTYRFRITQLGRERGAWLMAISGYVGPAPVSIPAYGTMIERQCSRLPEVSPQDVAAAIAGLVLPEQTVELAGLAASSGRSLFLYGPPGNGKTTLGRLLHRALHGSLWIPYCIGVENQIIRVFDRHCHTESAEDLPREAQPKYDQRWVRVRRPLIVVGGELTLDDLELIHDSARRYYEAPLHVKANGGVFLLDDFGCQRTAPNELLNRWIVPLEQRTDYLTLATGQQIQVPFRNMLVISTNLDVHQVMAPGLLRRMGYRVCLRIRRRNATHAFSRDTLPGADWKYHRDSWNGSSHATGPRTGRCEPVNPGISWNAFATSADTAAGQKR